MNKIIKDYDNTSVNSSGQSDILTEISKLEEENQKLDQQIKEINAANAAAESAKIINKSNSMKFNEFNSNSPISGAQVSNSFSQSNIAANGVLGGNQFQINSNNSKSLFDNFFPTQQQFAIQDPFQSFDPFNSNSAADPFKSAPMNNIKATNVNKDFSNEDPFANAFDPFGQQSANQSAFSVDDPFSDKKRAPPPRPAPPRPQTPSLKPTKKASDMSQRPQSAMDFTRNNKLDLFNDFNDPFASTTSPTSQTQAAKDPFGNNGFGDWGAFGSSSNSNNKTAASSAFGAKDPFDPFA